MSKLSDYKAEVNKYSVLGYLLWWTIRDVVIEEGALEKLYEKHGLQDYFPKHVSDRKSFWRALKKFGKANPELLVRKIGENAEKIVYGIVGENQDFAKEDLAYSVECKVLFWKATGAIQFSDDNHPVAKEMGKQYKILRTHYISDDLRKAILGTIGKLNSLDVRKQGGVYFVPVAFSDMVAQFDGLIVDLSDTSMMYAMPILDTARTRKQMFRAFLEQADSELEEAEEEIKQMKEDANVRRDTVERRLERFKEFRTKAGMYADLFKGRAEMIETRIKTLEKNATEILTEITMAEVA